MQISPCTTSDQLSHPSYFMVHTVWTLRQLKTKQKHMFTGLSHLLKQFKKKKKKSLEISKIVWSSNAKFLFQIYFLLIFI